MPPDASKQNGPSGSGSSSRTSSINDRPLSGIFGVNKPSGPLSMTLLEDIKELFAYSPLFKNRDGSLPAENGGKGWRGGKRDIRMSKAEKKRNAPPKIGQGGTLDPLADGVLGEWSREARSCKQHALRPSHLRSALLAPSDRCWERYKAVAKVLGLHKRISLYGSIGHSHDVVRLQGSHSAPSALPARFARGYLGSSTSTSR